MRLLEPPAIGEVRAARERIMGVAIRTPLVRLGVEETPAARLARILAGEVP